MILKKEKFMMKLGRNLILGTDFSLIFEKIIFIVLLIT